MSPKRGIPLVPIVLIGLFGLGFVSLGVPGLVDTMRLRSSSSVAEARVTDSRILSTKYGLSHEIRYVFDVAGVGAVTRSDFLGRSDLWSVIPEEVWRTVTETKRIEVRYLPDKVSRSAPVVRLPNPWDDLTVTALGAAPLGFAVFVLWKRWKQMPRPKRESFR